ncbi:MAG: DUF6785 family protein [Pseudomonadota bacterium]
MPDKQGQALRPRAFAAGIVFAVLICALTPFNNAYRNATPLGGGYFPLAPFYAFFWLVVFTALTRRWFRGWTLFTGTELVFAWVIMVIVSGIAYTGFARTFFINLTAPWYFATPENRWQEILQPLLPPGLFPGDSRAIDLLYNGIPGGRDMGWLDLACRVPWSAWASPFLSWGIFMLVCYFIMLCLVRLIHRQALMNERMNFPLLIVPDMIRKAMDEGQLGLFFRNRFLWVGILVPVFLHGLNGLNAYFPSVPSINTLVLAGPYFPDQGLLSGFGKLKLYVYPAFIGFAFLASKQVSLSFWFFFIAGCLTTGVLTVMGLSFPASELGVTFGPTLSRPEETQMIGAFVVFFAFLMWLARFHFKGILVHAISRGPARDMTQSAAGDTLAFWGALAGSGILVLWFVFHGVSVLNALVLIVFFFMFVMVATRVVCQGGVTYFTLTAAPLDAINTLIGLKMFSSLGLLLAGVAQKVLFVDLRESVVPSLLHGHKVTWKLKGQATILGWVLGSMIVCLMVSAAAMILLCYRYGIRELELDWATRTTVSMYTSLASLIHHPTGQGASIAGFAFLGGIIMLVLVVCYQRFYWWPLHPIGYLMVYSSAMAILWVSFFAGWLSNAVCMRYGGVILYQRMRYFFVGLIMGDFLMGGLWATLGLFTRTVYQVLPT